jgi:hypothetical protein
VLLCIPAFALSACSSPTGWSAADHEEKLIASRQEADQLAAQIARLDNDSLVDSLIARDFSPILTEHLLRREREWVEHFHRIRHSTSMLSRAASRQCDTDILRQLDEHIDRWRMLEAKIVDQGASPSAIADIRLSRMRVLESFHSCLSSAPSDIVFFVR